MHYSNLIILECAPSDEAALEAAIEQAMGPHEDQGGFWDWYQIGGRWTGFFDGYKAVTDSTNWERCKICDGTGMRNDKVGHSIRAKDASFTCNGCGHYKIEGMAKGMRPRWPTDWKRYSGDVIPLRAMTEEQLERIYRVVCDRGNFGAVYYAPWRDEEKFQPLDKPTLAWLQSTYPNATAVIVDNHC